MEKTGKPSAIFEEITKEIDRINAKIDGLKKLFDVDLTDECSQLVTVLAELTESYTLYHEKSRSGIAEGLLLSKLYEVLSVEFRACNTVLKRLIRQFSNYSNELEESLIDTGELRRAINEATRLQAKASATPHTSEDLRKSIEILDRQIEGLSAASSGMKAREPEEKRKVAFRLVEIYVGLFAGLVIAYFTYTVNYAHSDPFASGNLGMLAFLYVLGCIGVYVAIGAIAKVRHKSQT